jgi:pimeloyl-ACP methyl ester carboxylesterase
VVLVHPATGSALVWGYQQPAFAKAGYRVIGYSRRSYYGSDLLHNENPGVASEDLHNLIEFLGISKFHAIGSAAGGGVAAETMRCPIRTAIVLIHTSARASRVAASQE